MGNDYLGPDAYSAQDEQLPEDDPRALFRRPPYNRDTSGGFRLGLAAGNGGYGGGLGGSLRTFERSFYDKLNTDPRYFQPKPQENVTPTSPTIAPNESPNRGGFNQAEGLARPDYSRGDELRAQAQALQHPSWWKKLVNGDEGLAQQAAHKYALADLEDLAAERKYRWDHPEAFRKAPELMNVPAGTSVIDKANPGKALFTAPKEAKEPKDEKFQAGGKWWTRQEGSDTARPMREEVPDMPGPNPDGSAGYKGKGAQLSANEREFAPKGYKSENFQDKNGDWYEKVFDPDTGKTVVRPLQGMPQGTAKEGRVPGGKAAGGKKDWTPQELEKAAERIAGKRKSAAASGDPEQIRQTENSIKAMLNSGGLKEDPLTGELSKLDADEPKAKRPDLANPPNGTKRTDRKTGKTEIFLRGKWQPFEGAKGTK